MVAVARAAIGNARWPRIIIEGDTPVNAPYTPEHLKAEDVSERFINYLRRVRRPFVVPERGSTKPDAHLVGQKKQQQAYGS